MSNSLFWYESPKDLKNALILTDLKVEDVQDNPNAWTVHNCRVTLHPTTGRLQVQGKSGFLRVLLRRLEDVPLLQDSLI